MNAKKDAQPGFYQPLVLAGFFFLAFGTYLCSPLYDPNFLTDIVVGRWVTSHLAFPVDNLWTDVDSSTNSYANNWLWSALLANIYAFDQFRGVVFFKLFLSIFGLLAIFTVLTRVAGSLFLAGIITVLAAAGLYAEAEIDAALLGSALAVVILGRVLQLNTKSSALGDPFLCLLIVLLVNATSEGIWVVCSSSVLLLQAQNISLKRRCIRILLVGLSAMVHPLGVFHLLNDFNQGWVRLQLLSQGIESTSNIFHYSFAMYLALAVLLGAVLLNSQVRFNLAWSCLLLIFAAGAFVAKDWIAPAIIIYALATGFALQAASEFGLGRLGEGLTKFSDLLSKLPMLGVSWILLCLAIVNIYQLWKLPSLIMSLPVELGQELDKPDAVPLFHEAKIGGLIQFLLANEQGELSSKAFIDNKTRFGKQDINFTAHNIISGSPNWTMLLEELGIKSIVCQSGSALCSLLEIDSDWQEWQSETLINERFFKQISKNEN